jgi:hypothetical protein
MTRVPVVHHDLAERADVVVYDAWASGDAKGARVLIGQPTGARLHAAIQTAVGDAPPEP